MRKSRGGPFHFIKMVFLGFGLGLILQVVFAWIKHLIAK
jgi:hypothetical protein